MSIFFEALARLKREITRINQGVLAYDMTPLSNQSLATEVFANPMLLPPALVANDSAYVLPENSSYTNHVIQASWNVAQLIENIATAWSPTLAKATNVLPLITCFNYFEAKTHVFKIIDSKTLELGLALQQFLEVTITDEKAKALLGNIAMKNLNKMNQILTARLYFFEVHNPWNIDSTIALLRLKKTRLSLWQDESARFIQDTARATVEPTLKALSDWLHQQLTQNPQQWEQLEAIIANLQHMIESIKQRIELYQQFNKKWAEENQALNLPESIPVSDYIQLLATPRVNSEALINKWLDLFNGDCIIKEEKIAQSLYEQLSLSRQLLQTAEALLSECQVQMQSLQARHAALIQLQQRAGRFELVDREDNRIDRAREALYQARKRAREEDFDYHALDHKFTSHQVQLALLAKARRDNLHQAFHAIKAVIHGLQNHNGLYIPIFDVSKRHLLTLLDTTDTELLTLIDKTYAREKDSNRRRGFNLTYLTDLFYSKTIGTDYLKNQLNKIILALKKKQRQIQLELAIDIFQPGNPSAETHSLSPNTLYQLQLTYQAERQQLFDKKINCALVKLDEQVADINHEQAYLAQWNSTFAFNQADHHQQLTLLQALLTDLAEMHPATAIERYNQHCGLIQEIDEWLHNSQFAQQHSINKYRKTVNIEQWHRLQSSFIAHKTDYWPQVCEALKNQDKNQTPALIALLKSKNLVVSEPLLEKMGLLLQEHDVLIAQYEQNSQEFQEIETLIATLREKRRTFEVTQSLMPDDPSGTDDENYNNPIEDKIKSPHHTLSIVTTLPSLRASFFGPRQATAFRGIFGAYLEERAQTYWLSDMLSQFASLTLGYFGYKTEALEREKYVDDLQRAIDAYELGDENYSYLSKHIESGLERFKPRSSNKAEERYQKSLHSKLLAFQETLDSIVFSSKVPHQDFPVAKKLL